MKRFKLRGLFVMLFLLTVTFIGAPPVATAAGQEATINFGNTMATANSNTVETMVVDQNNSAGVMVQEVQNYATTGADMFTVNFVNFVANISDQATNGTITGVDFGCMLAADSSNGYNSISFATADTSNNVVQYTMATLTQVNPSLKIPLAAGNSSFVNIDTFTCATSQEITVVGATLNSQAVLFYSDTVNPSLKNPTVASGNC